MTLFIGADHAGYELKETLQEQLLAEGYEVIDKGAFAHDPDDDYPVFCSAVAEAVADNPDSDKGIVLGGSGQGEAMVCNRFAGIRAAVYYGGSPDIVTLSRTHNDANILSLGSRFITAAEATDVVQQWIYTDFSKAKRHIRRLKQIEDMTT